MMAKLHISKVAVGCASVQALQARQDARRQSGVVPLVTRFRPTRADELIGGSIYWIIKHRIVARQTILGFADNEGDRRTIIRLDSELIAVRAVPKRAHQGWRYLSAAEAPPDLAGEGGGVDALPADLARKLTAIALL